MIRSSVILWFCGALLIGLVAIAQQSPTEAPAGFDTPTRRNRYRAGIHDVIGDAIGARHRRIGGISLLLEDPGTPHSWLVQLPAWNHGQQRQVVVLLVRAGARVEPEWLESAKVRADSAMQAALQGSAV